MAEDVTPAPDEALTDKQRAFVLEYLIDLNATAAAKRAGYSEHSAKQIGTENLSKPSVQAAIAAAMEERAKRTEITADRVLLELAKIGFSNMRRFATWGPRGVEPLPCENMSEEDAACVSEVSQTVSKEGGSIRFKLHDKVSALEKLGRHLALWDRDGSPINPAQGDERTPSMTKEQAEKLLAERLKPQPRGDADDKAEVEKEIDRG